MTYKKIQPLPYFRHQMESLYQRQDGKHHVFLSVTDLQYLRWTKASKRPSTSLHNNRGINMVLFRSTVLPSSGNALVSRGQVRAKKESKGVCPPRLPGASTSFARVSPEAQVSLLLPILPHPLHLILRSTGNTPLVLEKWRATHCFMHPPQEGGGWKHPLS